MPKAREGEGTRGGGGGKPLSLGGGGVLLHIETIFACDGIVIRDAMALSFLKSYTLAKIAFQHNVKLILRNSVSVYIM